MDQKEIIKDELSKASNDYYAAIEMWKLGCQLIYTRFGTMLTANSIVIAITSIMFAQGSDVIPKLFLITLSVAGIVLCILWVYFTWYGLAREQLYRNKLIEIQEQKIACNSDVVTQLSRPATFFFQTASYTTIGIFMAVYIILLVNII